MALVTTTEMFKKAYDGGYAIGAFNVNNMEIVQGITEACREEKAPVILQVSKGARAYANHTYLVKLVEAAVIECPEIPIALHLDHGPDFETCKACIDGGFTSVMIDASSKPFAENIEITRKVVEYAHDHGVVVEAELGTLAGIEDDVQVSAEDLSVNPNLPSEWRNILLLGSDGHTEIESARTDAMIICSINTTTGQVKLCSIMRDMSVEIPDRGLYKINSANFWGGPWLAVKLVNECFGMNIEDYAMVNFFGFQQVADYLGGIEMDITKEEMEQIDHNVGEQIRLAREAGIDESNLPQEHLTTYGENTHLDGRQTLGYARIRKLAGEDFGRAERQRKVLMALLEKMMGPPPLEITRMAANLFDYFNTSLTAQEAITIASQVLSSGLSEVETLYLPQNGTYSPETRNNTYMMYDVDYQTNANALYEFIYN